MPWTLGALIGVVVLAGPAAGATGSADWPAYLNGPTHSSDNPAATAITPADANHLTAAWNWMPGAPPIPELGYVLNSSPTVYDGVVYIGANNGTLYALDEATGAVVWQRFFAYSVRTTCVASDYGYFGFASTATVADDPGTGDPTLYVNAPDGYLYALDPATGDTVWSSVVGIPSNTENSFMAWSSPTVANGHVYVGTASQCDSPLVYAGVHEYDQETGAPQAVFYNVPAGRIGASVWSSVAVGKNGTVYETTGNGPGNDTFLGDSESIVALNGSTLAQIGAWQIPPSPPTSKDSDFGGSPTLFSAVLPGSTTRTPMVGACNKDGTYYALRADDLAAGPVWTLAVSGPPLGGPYECIAAAVWNGRDLFIAGPRTTVDGTTVLGSIREVDPATGAVLWATGLSGSVDGSPTLDGKQVLSVATYQFGAHATNADYLIDADTGAVLATLGAGGDDSAEFSQPVFADGYVFTATYGDGLTAYAPPG